MRPTYETAENINNEAAFAQVLREHGFTVHRLKKYYPADFFVEFYGEQWLVEYKRRSGIFGAYNFGISARKISNCRTLADTMGIEFRLMIEYDDGYYSVDPKEYTVKIGGRYDRGDAGDVEPMLYIDDKHFKRWNI